MPPRGPATRCSNATPRRRVIKSSVAKSLTDAAKSTMVSARNKSINIGSDCTGLNAAAVALESLGIEFKEVFASEKDAATRHVLEFNFQCGKTYTDVVARDHAMTPAVDLYTAGPPCQSFSTQGQRAGLDSTNGLVGLACVEYIVTKQPKIFIIENVPALCTKRFASTFKLIMNCLRSIKNKLGRPRYRLTYAVLNALDFGLPQHRKRLFIVGVSGEKRGKAFRWPDPCSAPNLADFLDDDFKSPPAMPETATEQQNYLRCVESILKQKRKLTDDFIADLGGGFPNTNNLGNGFAPCLTRSHCGNSHYYVFSRGRKLKSTEMFRLQGFPDGRIKKPAKVSDRQLRLMIGNAFPVRVVSLILARLLFAAGLVHEAIGFVLGTGTLGHAWPKDS